MILCLTVFTFRYALISVPIDTILKKKECTLHNYIHSNLAKGEDSSNKKWIKYNTINKHMYMIFYALFTKKSTIIQY